MEGIFVTGTDTDVGKTTFCGGLLKALHGHKKVAYWKPIQTGTIVGDDTNDIKGLLEIGPENFVEPAYRFPDPVSPHFAAKKWGKHIELDVLKKAYATAKADRFLIVEGAGGLLVPYADGLLQLDWIKYLKQPLLLVAEDRVGAINQVLLTLDVCRDEGLDVLGVVLSKSRGSYGNAEAITQFGKIEVLAEIPPHEDARTLLAQVSGHPRLRKLLGLPIIP